jgi:hypothetical protein
MIRRNEMMWKESGNHQAKIPAAAFPHSNDLQTGSRKLAQFN